MAPDNDNHDDDFLTTVPEPDAEPTTAERAHARTFADLVDKTLSGRTPPRIITRTAPAAQLLPETWTSRPADPLIGPIKKNVGDASARIDTIFADRLDGYRELRLRGRKP
jgi:hypothetical protein